MLPAWPSPCKSSVVWCPEPSSAKNEPNARMSCGELALNPKKRSHVRTGCNPPSVPSKCSIKASVGTCCRRGTDVEKPTAHAWLLASADAPIRENTAAPRRSAGYRSLIGHLRRWKPWRKCWLALPRRTWDLETRSLLFRSGARGPAPDLLPRR